MAVVKLPARNYKLFVVTDDVTPTLVEVKGQNTMTITRTANVADTSSFDENGWLSSMKTTQTMAITLEGFKYIDLTTGLLDPGQQLVDDSIDTLGIKGLLDYELTLFDEDGGELTKYTFTAHAIGSDNGGGIDEADKWGATLQAVGAVVKTNVVTP